MNSLILYVNKIHPAIQAMTRVTYIFADVIQKALFHIPGGGGIPEYKTVVYVRKYCGGENVYIRQNVNIDFFLSTFSYCIYEKIKMIHDVSEVLLNCNIIRAFVIDLCALLLDPRKSFPPPRTPTLGNADLEDIVYSGTDTVHNLWKVQRQMK